MEEGRFASDKVEVWTVRRRLSERAARVGVGLIVLPVVLAMLGIVGDAISSDLTNAYGSSFAAVLFSVWAGSWLLFAPVAFLVSLFASLRARMPQKRLAVADGALTLVAADPRTFRREDIDGALVVVPNKGPSHAEVALRSGDVLHIQAGSDEDATEEHALVDALGFGGKRRRASLPLGGARGLFQRGLAAVGAGLAATIIVSLMALSVTDSLPGALFVLGAVFLSTVLLVARIAGPHRVVAGADGLVLERLFGKTFLPRHHIFGVERIEGGVSVLLRGDDEKIRQVPLPADRPERSQAMLRTLREALSSGGEEEGGAGAALLARGGESIATWRGRVRKLIAAEGGYRARRVSMETLVRTARDPDAPAELRIGAAMAIAGTDDADAKKRLRIATEGVANEEVRRALEAAAEAEAEDEAIAQALARAERGTQARG